MAAVDIEMTQLNRLWNYFEERNEWLFMNYPEVLEHDCYITRIATYVHSVYRDIAARLVIRKETL